MHWYAWLGLGIICGWALKSMQCEWRMQALTNFVLDSLKEMRDEWKPDA